MPKYNHAFTISFEVITEDPEGGTLEERMAGLMKRLSLLLTDADEARGALMGDSPYDTYEMDESESSDV
jgi:hypothetical protein